MNLPNQNPDVESTRREAVRLSKRLKVPVVPATSGKKIFSTGWTSMTPAKSRTPAALSKFKPGQLNIAIVQGNHLYSIDVDDEEFLSELLELNPWLHETLFSTGSGIGGNFWLKPIGPCPKSAVIKRSSANKGHLEQVGELRAAGNATIIYGYHAESGREYTRNGKQPLEIEFEKIKWPRGTYPFNPEIELEGDQFTERTEENRRDRSDTDDVILGTAFAITSIQQAVSLCTPVARRSTDKLMFKYCRALKAFALHRGEKLNGPELDQAFSAWYEAARPFLRDQPRSRYLREFLHRYDQAKTPLGPARLLKRALQRVDSSPPPSEAGRFSDDPPMMRLVSLLYYLQVEAGDQSFWISSRDCGKLFGISHAQAATWLKQLTSRHFRLLKIVSPHTASTCPRYRWTGSLPDKSGLQVD